VRLNRDLAALESKLWNVKFVNIEHIRRSFVQA